MTVGHDIGAMAQSFEQLGRVLLALAEFVEAEEALEECVALRVGINRGHWQTHYARNLLGMALTGQERFDEAEPLYRDALAIKRRTRGDDHISTAIELNNLGSLLHAMGRTDEAVPMIEEAVAIAERGQGSPRTVDALRQSLERVRAAL